MKHLSATELLSIVNNPETMPDHLKECDNCLKRLAALKEFQFSAARAGFIASGKTGECVDTETIAELFNGQCDEVRAETIKDHLQKCDHCFDLASYYHSESDGMAAAKQLRTPDEFKEKALQLISVKTDPDTEKPKPGWLGRWGVPALPAYATAILLWIAFFFYPYAPQVVMVGDPPSYSVHQMAEKPLPMFYFGESGPVIFKRPARMEVTVGRNEVRLDWVGMKGATEYSSILQEIKDGAPRTIAQFSTKETEAELERGIFSEGTTYRWIIAGALPENRYFKGSVEFRLE